MKNADIKKLIAEKFADAVVWDENKDGVLTVQAASLVELLGFLQANT